MLDFLERMRQKPEAVRVRFVFIISVSVTGIIFLVWLTVMGVRFSDVSGPDSKTPRSSDTTIEEIDNTVKNAIEKSRSEYEAFQHELQSIADTLATSSFSATSTMATTTTPQY